jgi:PAS domain S-box-containing protein
MDSRQETIKKIKSLLRSHRNGLTITDISQKLMLNRNSTAKYLEILLISGDVNLNTYGPAKVYTISQRMPISAMVKFSADIIILIDNDLRVLDANENALSLLDIDRIDIIGNRIDSLQSPLLARLAIPEVFDEIQSKGEIQREFAFTSHDEDRHYRVRLIPTVFDNLEEGITVIGEDVTKQIRFEESLMVSEARYRAIVQDQTDFICRWRPDGSVTYINEPLCRFLGISCKEACGKSIFSAVSAEDAAVIVEKISNISPDRPTGVMELKVMNADGVYRWHAWSNRGIFDNAGTLVECQSVGQDITERRRVEKALHDSELLYRSILNNIQDVYYRCDPKGTLVMASPSAPKLLGYGSLEEIIGENIAEKFYLYPVDREQFLKALFKEGKTSDYEITLKKRDGSAVVVSTSSSLLFDANGRLEGIEGFFRDITLRKNAEKALYESEERYRHVVEDQTEFICRFTPDGTYIFVNEAYCRYFGLKREEVIGTRFKPNIHPEDRDSVVRIFASLNPEHPVDLIDQRTIMPDGSIRWQRWVDRAIYHTDGRLKEYQSVGRDITDRKREEENVVAALKRARDQQAVLSMISFSPYLFSGDVQGLSASLTKASSSVLGVARVSVWLFNSNGDELQCIDLYEGLHDRHSRNHVLRRHEYENEFDALSKALYIDASDPLTDSRTAGYVDGYIKPNRITSMLDAVIRVTGKNLGVLCFEHVDNPHQWENDEISFACQLADQVGITLLNHNRKLADLALVESEERFRMIANLSPFPISIMDGTSNYRYLNKMFEQLFGYTLADIPTGKDWFTKAFPNENERQVMLLTWENAVEQSSPDEVRSLVYPVTCKDGSVRQVQFFPVTLENGEQFVVYEDLTPKNESERLRSILASIVESSNDAIIGKTLDGTIISWNNAAERIYGYRADEILGKSIAMIISPELRDQLPFFLERIRNGERIEHFRTKRVRKDGSPVAVSISLSPIKDSNGNIFGISTIAKNISDRELDDPAGSYEGY